MLGQKWPMMCVRRVKWAHSLESTPLPSSRTCQLQRLVLSPLLALQCVWMGLAYRRGQIPSGPKVEWSTGARSPPPPRPSAVPVWMVLLFQLNTTGPWDGLLELDLLLTPGTVQGPIHSHLRSLFFVFLKEYVSNSEVRVLIFTWNVRVRGDCVSLI